MKNTRILISLLIFVSNSSLAQDYIKDVLSGTTPPGLAPGAALGSYSISGFESVNFFSGALNFNIPLHTVVGRGEAKFTLGLPVENRWTAKIYYSNLYRSIVPLQNEGFVNAGYGPGHLEIRNEVTLKDCNGSMIAESALTRIQWVSSSGASTELLDSETNGASKLLMTACNNPVAPQNRKTIFKSYDGSSMTFISASDVIDSAQPTINPYPSGSGTLHTKDGTYYNIENGHVTWMIDRNGNIISFSRTAESFGRITEIKDSLERIIKIEYADLFSEHPNEDWIKFSGTADRKVIVRRTRLQNALRSDFSLKRYNELFVDSEVLVDYFHNPIVATEIELPNGQKYQLQYNSYGELARVQLPTGGAIEYEWAGGLSSFDAIERRVIQRRLFTDPGSTTAESKTFFTTALQGANFEVVEKETDGTDVLEPTVRRRKVHTFHGQPLNAIYEFYFSTVGREFKTEVQTPGNSRVQLIEHIWAHRDIANNQSTIPTNWDGRKDDPRIIETSTTLGTLAARKTFEYSIDAHNNIKKSCEYDYGNVLTRCTEYDYETNASYVDAPVHLRGLVKSQRVYRGTVLEAQTDTTYDQFGITDRPDISELAVFRRGSYIYRGNATTVSRLSLEPSIIPNSVTLYEYDIAGNVTKITHPKVQTTSGLISPETTISYSDNYCSTGDGCSASAGSQTYAFPTQVNQPGGLTIQAKYYRNLGQLFQYTDPNGRVTKYTYGGDDALDRLTKILHPTGGTTQFAYAANEITTSKSISAGVSDIVAKAIIDNLGRTSKVIRLNACGSGQNAVTETRYDSLGRASDISNPICGIPTAWTHTTFDELDRPLDITYPDNSIIRTRYTNNEAVTRDPADKWRKAITDALGRIKEVIEDPAASIDGTYTNSSPQNLSTTYTYDARDNLLTVIQGGRNRDFTYYSLGPLRTASSPEMGLSQNGGASDQNGIITYVYDPAGNMTSRTSPRSTSAPTDAITNFVYDVRGRLQSKTYAGAVSTTPAVNFCYDGSIGGTGCSSAPTDSDTANNPKNLKGRLTMVANGDAISTFDSYDGLGRVTTNTRTIKGQTNPAALDYVLPFSYGYNHLGLESVTYPSGRKVQYGYDGAAQIQTVIGNPGTTSTKNYVSAVNYAPHGAIAQMALANQRYEVTCFNSRLQVSAMLLRTQAPTMTNCSETTNNLAKLSFEYDVSNNGNLKSQTISDGASLSIQQSYVYDKLNRLQGGSESGGSGWGVTYGYDRWGNQWLNTITPSLPTPNAVTPLTSAWFTAKNRLTLGPGGYDLSGNQLKYNPYTLTYDGDNLVKEVTSTSNGSASYRYDGEGRRVKKVVGGVTTYFVYDALGQLAAEYEQGASTGQTAPCETCFLFTDHLGSTRAIHDSTGVKARYDYLPFGEYVPGTTSGRSTASCAAGVTNCYPGSGINTNTKVTQMFTSKERDAETGLDYFGARYMSSAQGRFTSPDEFMGGAVDPFTGQQVSQPGPLPYADIGDPQSLNKYAYVLNNPLRFTDPDGHCPWCIGAGIGFIGGGAASIISQKWSHPDQALNWTKVGASALGGLVAGGTLGLATAPATIATLGGATVLETGTAVGVGAAAGAGVVGGVVERAVESGGDLNAAAGTLGQIAGDAAFGAVTEGIGSKLINSAVQGSTTAGRAVSVGEAKIARGTNPSPSLPQRQAQLAKQQQAASGAVSAAADAAKRRAEEQQKRKKDEENR